MADAKKRKARSKRRSQPLAAVAQKHITQRIGAHQRAARKRKEAGRRARLRK